MALETLTDNGNSEWQSSNSGIAIVIVSGTFGGGTAQIQIEDEGGNAVAVSNGSGTSAFTRQVHCGSFRVRVNLTGATSPSLNVSHRAQKI